MRPSVLLAVAVACVASGAGAAPLWTVEKSEIAYLFYGEPDRPVLSISCGQQEGETGKDETRIEVEVETGTKPGKDKVVLRIEQDKGHKDVPLKPLICGGLSECKNQPDGEVYRYETSVPGKTLALDIASKGRKLIIDAPGAKIAAPARSGGLQEILRQLPELVSRSGRIGTGLFPNENKTCTLLPGYRGRCPMRALIAAAFVTDFVRVFLVARAVDGFRRRCLPLQRLRLQRRPRLARPRRVLRRRKGNSRQFAARRPARPASRKARRGSASASRPRGPTQALHAYAARRGRSRRSGLRTRHLIVNGALA